MRLPQLLCPWLTEPVGCNGVDDICRPAAGSVRGIRGVAVADVASDDQPSAAAGGRHVGREEDCLRGQQHPKDLRRVLIAVGERAFIGLAVRQLDRRFVAAVAAVVAGRPPEGDRPVYLGDAVVGGSEGPVQGHGDVELASGGGGQGREDRGLLGVGLRLRRGWAVRLPAEQRGRPVGEVRATGVRRGRRRWSTPTPD